MDKKILYYLIAGAALILVVWIIIAMNTANPVVPDGDILIQQPPKTESEINKEIAQKLNLPEGGLPLRVTMDDNGQSSSLTPGKNLSLMLGENYDWVITSSDENVLAKRSVDIDDDRVQGVYQVVGEGDAILSAQGTCKAGSQCVSPTANFSFNVQCVVSENYTPEDLVK